MLKSFLFKPVDPAITKHSVEQRGFVTVPFDYDQPTGETIAVFYRLIPTYGGRPDDESKPIIVVINGGPGIASSVYRPLDFNYENEAASENGKLNRFHYFLETHRVLIVDQRGTDGQSAPLNMSDPQLSPNLVSKYFSSDFQARDYQAVIQKVIPAGQPFYIIAQSYGGMVGMQYLSIPDVRLPNGIIFSSSALPYEDTLGMQVGRRREQLHLNQHLKKVVPDIETRLQEVRDHFQKVGLDPDRIHGLFGWLGKDLTGVWEPKFLEYLQELKSMNAEKIEAEMRKGYGDFDPLNYILSSCNFTPGYTDRTLAHYTTGKLPYEPWMLDENWVMLRAGQDGTDRGRWVDAMDANPPPATPFASVEKLREAIAKTQVLFTAADNDAFVPAEGYRLGVEKFKVAGHTQLITIPGGHHAIFLEEGYRALKTWTENSCQK